MTSDATRSVSAQRRIGRILCRAVICAAGLAVASAHAHAQTSPSAMAYTAYYVSAFLQDCDAGCYVEIVEGTGVVTPSANIGWGSQPTWSPTGALVAFSNGENIFIIPSTGGNAIPLTYSTGFSSAPAWSPDGGQIAFLSQTSSTSEIHVMSPDGSGVRSLSNRAPIYRINTDPLILGNIHPTWSPDSARIAFTCEVDLGNLDVCVVNRDGTGLVRLTNDPAADWS